MKKILLTILLGVSLAAAAVERISFEQLQADGWDSYLGRTIQITTPLYVVGNYYDSLLLSPERLYCAEEKAYGLADGDSTSYWQIKQNNRQKTICLHCKVTNYQLRTGALVRNLQAKVIAPRKMQTGATIRFANNKPERKPKMGRYDLLLCGANIENFFADLGGYATKKTTKEMHRLQTEKVAKALTHIQADIYGICEIEKGDKAPRELVEAMNAMAKADRYTFINQGWTNGDTISCCYIYRKDKVKPYNQTIFAYDEPRNPYAYRMMAQGFEDLASGERFIVSINHLKSKRSDGRETNTKRMNNVTHILSMLEEAYTQFGDSDIVLVGDFNCYSQEQPVQHLIRSGYHDQLMRFAPDNYSYIFKAEAGYLDRCFATPSMATQIIQVQPYHLNADYYYSRGYKRGLDNTMFRYADHDPILIGIQLRPHK